MVNSLKPAIWLDLIFGDMEGPSTLNHELLPGFQLMMVSVQVY